MVNDSGQTPLKILWDFCVVCLNSPIKKDRTDGRNTEGKIKMCQHIHAFRSYFGYLSCQHFSPLLAQNVVTN